jgi:beta-glucosidase
VKSGDNVEVSVTVKNSGVVDADEVVQLYVSDIDASAPVPIRSLQGFRRLFLKAQEQQTVTFTLTPRQLSLIDVSMKRIVEPGVFEVSVGGKQPGFKGLADAATTDVVMGRFEVIGEKLNMRER